MIHVKTLVIRETMMSALKAEDILSHLRVFVREMVPLPLPSSVRVIVIVVQRARMRRRVGEGRKEKNHKRLRNIPINSHILLLR
jgi:hypothetical protein